MPKIKVRRMTYPHALMKLIRIGYGASMDVLYVLYVCFESERCVDN